MNKPDLTFYTKKFRLLHDALPMNSQFFQSLDGMHFRKYYGEETDRQRIQRWLEICSHGEFDIDPNLLNDCNRVWDMIYGRK